MRVIWSESARELVRQTARYIRKEFGERSRRAFICEIANVDVLLGENPNLGRVEEFLSEKELTYRSIVVNRLNKLIYRVEGDTILIVSMWDTRREPNKQREQINVPH